MMSRLMFTFFFFFNDTATTEIYTLSLHDALPISLQMVARAGQNLPVSRDLDQGLGSSGEGHSKGLGKVEHERHTPRARGLAGEEARGGEQHTRRDVHGGQDANRERESSKTAHGDDLPQ